jgi:hypothetical protein
MDPPDTATEIAKALDAVKTQVEEMIKAHAGQ